MSYLRYYAKAFGLLFARVIAALYIHIVKLSRDCRYFYLKAASHTGWKIARCYLRRYCAPARYGSIDFLSHRMCSARKRARGRVRGRVRYYRTTRRREKFAADSGNFAVNLIVGKVHPCVVVSTNNTPDWSNAPVQNRITRASSPAALINV